jgi:hypothetical protein
MRAALSTSRSIFRQINVTKLLNSVHTLFTPDDSLAACQRREIRNGEKNRQAKI